MTRFSRAEIRRIIGEACTEEMENSIVALHLGVVDPLKDDLAKYKADAEKLPTVQKELDDLKAKPVDDYKAKYEQEHNDFEAYKQGITEKETKAAKERAVKAYFEGKNITGTNLDIAMRGASAEIAGGELDGDNIKDTKALDALVGGTFAGLVVDKTVKGADVATPPANNGAKPKEQSRAAALYEQHYKALYGEQKGTNDK